MGPDGGGQGDGQRDEQTGVWAGNNLKLSDTTKVVEPYD